MTIPATGLSDARTLVGEEPPTTTAPGWTSAAIAICSTMQIPAAMLLRLQPAGLPPIYIDFQHRAYEWEAGLESFPANPSSVDVETEQAAANGRPLFELPGESLEKLLWAIGLHAFPGAPASWLRPGDRYRLKRWPNLVELPHGVDHMRMTSILGAAFVTADELATAAASDAASAQRLINAFSLMGILTVTSAQQAAPAQVAHTEAAVAAVADETARSGSLFRRLRDRLGL
jgi:hypothetical protein